MMGWLAEKLWFWEEWRNYADAKEKDEARRALVTHLAKENVQLAMFTVVADDECERCAKICDAHADALDWGHGCAEFIDEALRECAAAIREGKG